MNSYSRLLYFVRPYYKRMIFAVFCMIVAAAAYLVVPWLIKNVVDQVLQDKNMFMLNLIVGAIILIFLIRGFATYGQTYNMSGLSSMYGKQFLSIYNACPYPILIAVKLASS